MIRKILFGVAGISLGTGYYLHQYKVDLNDEYLRKIIDYLHSQVFFNKKVESKLFFIFVKKYDSIFYGKKMRKTKKLCFSFRI